MPTRVLRTVSESSPLKVYIIPDRIVRAQTVKILLDGLQINLAYITQVKLVAPFPCVSNYVISP